VRQAPAFAFAESDLDERIRVNLGDVPGMPKGIDAMDVEGFKPSLLSRLFERFSSKR
jgi:hypothetical protein